MARWPRNLDSQPKTPPPDTSPSLAAPTFGPSVSLPFVLPMSPIHCIALLTCCVLSVLCNRAVSSRIRIWVAVSLSVAPFGPARPAAPLTLAPPRLLLCLLRLHPASLRTPVLASDVRSWPLLASPRLCSSLALLSPSVRPSLPSCRFLLTLVLRPYLTVLECSNASPWSPHFAFQNPAFFACS